MSRKDKQADLRRRMAEARSKLLQSQHPLPDDEEEGSEEVGGNIAAGTRKRPLSPGGGSGGILRKSKYSTKTDSAAKQSSSSSHQNSLGALVDGYGESSSDDDDDGNRNKNRAVSSANTVTISTIPRPSQPTKKNESKHNYKPDDGNNLNKSGSISKPASTKEDTSVSDEVWDEFNAMLEADEAATNDVIKTAITTKTSEEMPSATKSKEDDNDKETSPTSHNTEVQLNTVKKINKDDLYDNDDTNIMEQTSYEARLARLILLKNKKNKKKQTREMNEVASASTNLPSAGDFYDPSLAWAEEDEQEEDGEEVEKPINSGVDRDDEGEDGKTSLKQTTTTTSLSSSAAVSMAKILRGRRDEARMLASRGEDVANDGDLSQDDMDASDGKWF